MDKAKVYHHLTSTTRNGDNLLEVRNWTSETNSKDTIEISICKKEKDTVIRLASIFLSVADFEKFVSSMESVLDVCRGR